MKKTIDFLRNGGWFVISIAFVCVLVAGWVTAYCIWVPQTHRTVIAKVTKEWVQCTKDECTKLIGTDHGVFEDQDSFLYWKWNSSDYYNGMTVGHEYEFSVVGWRIPLLSTYPNIVSCENCS
jgi:hypothetical protein